MVLSSLLLVFFIQESSNDIEISFVYFMSFDNPPTLRSSWTSCGKETRFFLEVKKKYKIAYHDSWADFGREKYWKCDNVAFYYVSFSKIRLECINNISLLLFSSVVKHSSLSNSSLFFIPLFIFLNIVNLFSHAQNYRVKECRKIRYNIVCVLLCDFSLLSYQVIPCSLLGRFVTKNKHFLSFSLFIGLIVTGLGDVSIAKISKWDNKLKCG